MTCSPKLPRAALTVLLGVGSACQPATTQPPAEPGAALGDVHGDPEFTARLRIFDAQGNERTLPSVLDELAEADVVFFGERHTDDLTHRLEHAVVAGVAERREGELCLSLEMFERDVQPVLDEYVAGKIDEDWFLGRARPWPNYRTGYRPLVQAAIEVDAPVIAANTPRPLMRDLGGRGREAFDKLKAAHPEQLPAQMFPPSEAYQQRVGRALRGHGHSASKGGDALWSVQNYWDNTMADAVAKARDKWPDRAVVHVAGGFHIEQHEGTVAQFKKRRADDVVKTIVALPTFDLAAAAPQAELADFVAYVRADAHGPESGQLAVTVPGQLRWHLSLPKARKEGDTHPFVVVLADHNERAEDALLRWRARLSDTAVVAAVVPPYRQQSDLGWIERRWFFPGSVGSDLSPVVAGLPRLIAYARRHLPIEAASVTVVGEGTGGAAALWSTLYGDDLDARVVAVVPTLPHALGAAALPDAASAVAGLTIIVEGPPAPGLAPVVEGLGQVGVTPQLVQLATDSPTLAREHAEVVAKAVGAPVPSFPPNGAHVLVVGGLAPHGRAWAHGLAARWEAAGTATTVADTSQSPLAIVLGSGSPRASQWVANALHGTALPRPAASFGGGTIVVIPSGMPDRVAAAWKKTVEASKEKRGRFAPIELATEGTGQLRQAALTIQAAGWSDVVVVPAVFAAHPNLMRRLRDGVTDMPEDLTVQWLPGFGAAVARELDGPDGKADPAPDAGQDKNAKKKKRKSG
ncbi:MAG: ChaN family lipoprotein [Myxococcota bacterium]